MLGLSGLGVVVWALFSDRARGRRRCPRCWYDLKGVPGEVPELKCPECGHAVRRERALGRTRRKWRVAAAAVVVLLVPAYLAANGPRIVKQGWRGAVPTLALIAYVETFGDEPDITKSFAAGRGGVPAMTFKSFLVMPGAAPRVRTLSEELQRRCEDGELLLLERNLIGAGSVLMYVGRSERASPPRRMRAWHKAAIEWGLVPIYQKNWVERVWLRRAVTVPERWLRGEPVRVIKDPHDPWRLRWGTRTIRVLPEWVENFDRDAMPKGELRGDGSMVWTLPPCPANKVADVTFELAEATFLVSGTPFLPMRVTIDGPRVWVDSCEALAEQVPSAGVEAAMAEGVFVGAVTASPDPALKVEVFRFRTLCAEGLAVGATAELLHDGKPVGRAKFQIDPLAMASLDLPFDGDPALRAAWPTGHWQLRIKSDACAVLMLPGAKRCWKGELVTELTSGE